MNVTLKGKVTLKNCRPFDLSIRLIAIDLFVCFLSLGWEGKDTFGTADKQLRFGSIVDLCSLLGLKYRKSFFQQSENVVK